MAGRIRFHSDQHCPNSVAEGLRRLGIDVMTTRNAGLQDATDDEHLQFARREGRVLYTRDEDFVIHHSRLVEPLHAGIIYAPMHQRLSVGEQVKGLQAIQQILDAEEMRGRLVYLTRDLVRGL